MEYMICEKWLYGGTNAVVIKQLFYTFGLVFIVFTAHRGRKMFCTCPSVTKSAGSDQTPRSISFRYQLFANDTV